MAARPKPTYLVLPSSFPAALFDGVNDRIMAKMPNPTPARDNCGGGHNGVRYRLRACADYSKEFVRSVRRFGDAPPAEHRYKQERQLFGFFVSGLAALDSFSFFLYFAAAHIRPAAFPTQKPRDIRGISTESTCVAFGQAFPKEPITTALNKVVTSSQFKEWKDYRNIVAHRSAPGRVIYASIGGNVAPRPADWKIDPTGILKIDVKLTASRLDWLVTTLAGLVTAADQFALKYF